ncbi:hypothetical protein I4U23_029765 [Adineta vaga]|nr:hypothetical protein I4U23_029765 [Adineta vaga]
MEYDSSISMMLPDSIDLVENDFDSEDIVHEQTKQNEIIELIMAAFQGHDEPTDDDDDDDYDDDDTGSLSISQSSYHSTNEQQILYENMNIVDENHVYQQNESLCRNQQILLSSPVISTKSVSSNHHSPYDQYLNQIENNSVKTTTLNHSSINTLSPNEQVQIQYLYHTSPTKFLHNADNQSNKLRLLCTVKDQKVNQLEVLCEEYRKKYENETRTLKYQLSLSEQSRYECEKRYQQIETTKIQLEKKLSESESLIGTLEQKGNKLQLTRSNQDSKLLLCTTREKYEEEILSLNEKLQNIHMNLQEKAVESDELRAQLELAYKTNDKTIFEQVETIAHLTEELHNSQRQYTDLLAKNSLESSAHNESKRQLTRVTEDKDKLEHKCQELQSEIRTLRECSSKDEEDIENVIFAIQSIPLKNLENNETNSSLDEAIIHENIHLKQRIDEFVLNEQHLIALNEDLQRKIQGREYKSNHRERSDSYSSTSTDETVITKSTPTEQIRNLTNQIENYKREYADLEEKYDYEKHELQTMIEQLREDVIDLDKTKQLYKDVCEEKNSLEDKLQTKFEFELKTKLDDLCRILEEEYQDKLTSFKNDPKNYNQDSQQRLKELMTEIEQMKVQHEKQIIELNNELDQLKSNDDVKTRLLYTEKEFEQLKQDYYNLNIKQKELLDTCSNLENEIQLITQLREENRHLKQTIDNENVRTISSDQNEHQYKEEIECLQTRINEYENEITKYEGYRIQLQDNLQKLSQQRDTYKIELNLTKESLIVKEEEYNQLKHHSDECEKVLHNNQEKLQQYELTIQDLQVQIKQYELQRQETNKTRLSIIRENDYEYNDKISILETEKRQLEQRLYESNRALDLADSHLQQEVEKIKRSLEQEYNRQYELDQKQHQHEIQQLRQELTNEIEKQRLVTTSITPTKTTIQDIEEIKRMYRTENERLYHENIELSQHQSKLIEDHQKQMQIMKKELDDGYNNVINEFQQEQTRLQTRYDQLKRQLTDAQQTIEQLKSNLNLLKTRHYDGKSILRENSSLEYSDNSLKSRLDNLVKLLEQSNDALNQERALHTKQEFEYQQTISSLQKKIADMIKQHIESVDEIKHELHQERLKNQERIVIPRPTSVPEFAHMNLPTYERKPEQSTTNTDRFRGNIPILKRTSPFIQPRGSYYGTTYGQPRSPIKKTNPK